MVARAGTWFGGVIVEQQLMELAGAPAPGFPELEDRANHRRRGGMGALLGPMGAIGQAVGS